MNPLNHDVFEQIDEWIHSGNWKTDKNFSYEYDENIKAHRGTYVAPWFMDFTDEEWDNIYNTKRIFNYFINNLIII